MSRTQISRSYLTSCSAPANCCPTQAKSWLTAHPVIGRWSVDGTPVPQDPGLATDLFVDFRSLIEVPQFAGYDIYEALLGGNSATIDAALQTGLSQVDTALAQFPVAVFDDIVTALGGTV